MFQIAIIDNNLDRMFDRRICAFRMLFFESSNNNQQLLIVNLVVALYEKYNLEYKNYRIEQLIRIYLQEHNCDNKVKNIVFDLDFEIKIEIIKNKNFDKDLFESFERLILEIVESL